MTEKSEILNLPGITLVPRATYKTFIDEHPRMTVMPRPLRLDLLPFPHECEADSGEDTSEEILDDEPAPINPIFVSL